MHTSWLGFKCSKKGKPWMNKQCDVFFVKIVFRQKLCDVPFVISGFRDLIFWGLLKLKPNERFYPEMTRSLKSDLVNICVDEFNISSFQNRSISQTHAAKSFHSKQHDVFQRFKTNDQYVLEIIQNSTIKGTLLLVV